MFKLLLAIFIPPLYLMICGKWIQAILNAIPYLIAVTMLITIVGALFAPIPWIFSFFHAIYVWNEERTERHMKQHASMVASAVAQNPEQQT